MRVHNEWVFLEQGQGVKLQQPSPKLFLVYQLFRVPA